MLEMTHSFLPHGVAPFGLIGFQKAAGQSNTQSKRSKAHPTPADQYTSESQLRLLLVTHTVRWLQFCLVVPSEQDFGTLTTSITKGVPSVHVKRALLYRDMFSFLFFVASRGPQ